MDPEALLKNLLAALEQGPNPYNPDTVSDMCENLATWYECGGFRPPSVADHRTDTYKKHGVDIKSARSLRAFAIRERKAEEDPT